jgi:hypothetical protein
MHIAFRFALAGALLPALSAAQAQDARTQAPAGDPAAAVPATIYRPAIAWRPEAAPDAPPDRRWADSNAAVAGYNAMALTMKKRTPAADEAHAGHVMPMPMPMPPAERKETP